MKKTCKGLAAPFAGLRCTQLNDFGLVFALISRHVSPLPKFKLPCLMTLTVSHQCDDGHAKNSDNTP